MKKFLLVGLSSYPNTHSKEMRQVFNTGEWQAEDIAVQHPDLNNEIIRVANAYKPNLCWIQIQAPGISKEAIEALKANNCFIIQWCGDIRHTLPQCYFDYAKWGIDLTTFSNMRDVEIMKGCGYDSEFLQIGYSTELYYADYSIEKDIDISFMGNSFSHFPLSGLRRDMVNALKKVFGDRFKAFGNGMPDGNFNGNQQGEADIYRRSKIGISLSHFDEQRYTSDRVFRLLGCGAMVMAKEYPGICIDFPDNGDYLQTWCNIPDLISEINIYLSQDQMRLNVAKNGHELALNTFTFRHMALEIENLYNKYKP